MVRGRMVRGLLVVLAFYGAGELSATLLGLPLPGAILGLVAFVAALRVGLVKKAWVDEACTFLTGRMALFLLPQAVLVVWKVRGLAGMAAPIVVSSVVSTLAVLVVVAKVGEAVERR